MELKNNYFNTRRTMSGYRNPEVGIIPLDWVEKCLTDVIQSKKGSVKIGPFGSQLKKELLVKNGFKVYGQENIYENNLVLGDRFISKKHFDMLKSCELLPGDFIVSMMGTIGKCMIVPDNIEKGIIDSHLIRIRFDKDKVSPIYITHLFNSSLIFKQTKKLSVGGIMEGLSSSIIRKIIFSLPPTKAEQTGIATALSDIDSLITALDKLIAKKRNIKQGTMQDLLSGRKRLLNVDEMTVGYKNTDIGIIPSDWNLISYGEAFNFLTSASYSREQLSNNENVMYIHYGDIHTKWKHKLDFSKNELPSINDKMMKNYALIKDGDLIMADASEDYDGIGVSVEVENICNSKAISGLHTFLLRDKNDYFVPGIKGYFHTNKLVKKQFDRLATGLKVYGVSKNNLIKVLIPLPPTKAEQTAIVQILCDMNAEIDALEKKRDKFKALKQGMMQELLTGRIRLV